MTMQFFTHHGFWHDTEAEDRSRFEVDISAFEGWLLLIAVAGLTVFLVISFSLL